MVGVMSEVGSGVWGRAYCKGSVNCAFLGVVAAESYAMHHVGHLTRAVSAVGVLRRQGTWI